MTTQSDPNVPSIGDDPIIETLLRHTGDTCPASGYWEVKGDDGREWIEKGQKFPPYKGRNVDWQGAYEK